MPTKPGLISKLRVIVALNEYSEPTINDLVQATRLSATTIRSIVRKLEEKGFVELVDVNGTTRVKPMDKIRIMGRLMKELEIYDILKKYLGFKPYGVHAVIDLETTSG